MPAVQSVNSGSFIIASGNDGTAPSGLAVGDLMVACLVRGASGNAITAPSGWTLIHHAEPTVAATMAVHSYWKIATAGDVSAGTWSWTWTGSLLSRMGVYRITGHDVATPIFDETWDEDGASNRQPNIFDSVAGDGGSFTPTANSLIIATTAWSLNSAGAAVPSAATDNPTWTEQWDVDTSSPQTCHFQSASALRPQSTQLGDVTIDGGSSTKAVSSFISIKPGITSSVPGNMFRRVTVGDGMSRNEGAT
jgi:hypothetical protein